MGFGWQPFTLPEFSIKKLPGSWVSLSLGDQQKFYLEKPDKSMHTLPNGNLLESDAPAMAGSIGLAKLLSLVAVAEEVFCLYKRGPAVGIKQDGPAISLEEVHRHHRAKKS